MLNWVKPSFEDLPSQPTKKRKIDPKPPKNLKVETSLKNWTPQKKEELVVHKKKIEEVEEWLKSIQKNQGSSILLISGPPGCGKMTTLRVLCKNFNINLIEYIPQMAKGSFETNDYQSETSSFEEFVMRATRYSNVLNSSKLRLITVKDIPNSFIKDSQKFHEFLESFATLDGLYMSFIMTDVNIIRDLFSDKVKLDYNIKTISFNPVTQKNVKTVLEKISNRKEYINNIALTCNGDIRNAIETLNFMMRGQKLIKPEKEDSLDLFHGLGRILYAKKEHNAIEIAESFISSPELFVRMLQQNYLHTFSSIHDVAKASHKLSSSDLLLSEFKDASASRVLSLIVASGGLMLNNSNPIKKFQPMEKPKNVANCFNNVKLSNFYNNDAMLDVLTYGRKVPQFCSSNQDLLFMYEPLK